MTGPYLWAWVIMALVTPAIVYGFLRGTRGWAFAGLRRALAVLAPVWLLVPAEVPGFPGHYAPAFVVLLFESLFQHDGKPRAAAIILAAATLLAVALMLLWAVVRRSRKAVEVSGESA
jgi:hypothetical protein